MTLSIEGVTTQTLSLPEELILMLLNEESGYFHQVPGWDLNCTVAGAVLAELSLMGRIDTDVESLFIVDRTETGDPALDPILKEIADEPIRRNTQYWIERLAPRAESVVDLTLDRLVDLKILEHHDGEFWTLSRNVLQAELSSTSTEGTAAQFVRTRISKVIFNNEIPDPRDVIIIALIDTCDVFLFIFQLDDEIDQRSQSICSMALLGRSTFRLHQEDSHRLAAQDAVQPTPSQRQHRRALCGPRKGVRPGVQDTPAVQETDALPRRDRHEPLGAPARAHVPESQGLLLRLREGLRRERRDAFHGRRRPFPAAEGHV
ncbi:MAG: GPP34 family phosphoprotein, partial [Chloroflexi bacterium]|nr:GPP34 family phosphoprotein [Chloroflexota bacterium]